MKKLGFIGLGNMGRLMTGCLLKKGYEVTVYDIVPEAVDACVAMGAKAAASAADAGKDADVVFLMVLNYKQIAEIAFGENGLLSNMKKGSVVVVNSTVAPSEVQALEAEAVKYGVDVVDAPVSGSKARAEDGTLVLMTGCSDEVFERVKDVLYAVGSNTIHVGSKVGMGQAVKAVNQMLVSVHAVVTGEAMVMAQKAGVDPEVLRNVISKSVGNSFVFESKSLQLMDRDFETRGALDLNVKDLGICLQMGKELGTPMYLSAIAREVFATAQMKGYGKEDFCAVAKVYEEAAGCEIRRRG